ncbi:MAG: right-handed parallel beta-helix repeat-containing protein [Nitrospirales bacterium]|nr:right-handed parallel beta-helix repeat-containing protein [Nitrospirales bacterium]
MRFIFPKITCFMLLVVFVAATSWAEVKEIFPGDSFKGAFELLGPGDTLIVHEGTYSESGARIRISAKGTESQPIIVKGADGEARPLITRPVSSTPQNTINIEGATYVTIRHLEITGNGDGINLSGEPHHITIEDSEIHHIDVGINFRSSMDSIFVRRNHIYNTSGTAEAMYVGCNYASCGVSNSIIEQNWIHDTRGSQGDGIEIKYGSWGNIIRDNVIHDANYPCILAYGVTDANIDRPNIIEGNVVWNCGQGIVAIADAIVRNNIVIGTLETQSHEQVPVMRNVTIGNNTVIGSIALRGWGGGNLSTSLSLANNVLYGGSITNPPSAASFSSNLQYNFGTSGIFVDPDNWDFWPAPGSPLIGAADAARVQSKDFNGTSRQDPFDVGAYETEGLTSNPGWPIQDSFKDGASNADVIPPLPPAGLTIIPL